MYTSESEFFSPEFEKQAKDSIHKVIRDFESYDNEMFAKVTGVEMHHVVGVKDFGHRWKNVDQIYHSMIMRISQRMRDERGPGLLKPEEAKKVENMHLDNPYLFEISAAEGLRGAASCDEYYLYEKHYD